MVGFCSLLHCLSVLEYWMALRMNACSVNLFIFILNSASRRKCSSCPVVGMQGQPAGLGPLEQVGVKHLAQGLLELCEDTRGSNCKPSSLEDDL